MEWTFDYLGEKEGRQFFCIITDDGKGRGQGLSTCFHYYSRNTDKSLKSLNYMEIPTFKEKPSRQEALFLRDAVTGFFHGWIPYKMNIN